jgi:ABC-type nitrate/sulfonate/bicarbonate transport system substrate-binding protein
MRFDQPNECFLFSDYGVELVGFGFVTTESYLEENPDVVAAFAEATLQGYEMAFEDPAAGVAAVYEMSDDVPNLAPEEEMTAAIEALEPLAMVDADLGEPYGFNSPERWATMVETMTTFAELDPETDPESLYTNEFLPS